MITINFDPKTGDCTVAVSFADDGDARQPDLPENVVNQRLLMQARAQCEAAAHAQVTADTQEKILADAAAKKAAVDADAAARIAALSAVDVTVVQPV